MASGPYRNCHQRPQREPGKQFLKRVLPACVFLAVALAAPDPAFAWGDEGHKIIALIAEHYLDPAARAKVTMLLAADTDTLTGHDIASEATWADKYRDSDRDTTRIRYEATRLWHFVDIEVAEPNLALACSGHPPLPPGIPASKGPPRACVVDKIDQFAAELGNPATNRAPEFYFGLVQRDDTACNAGGSAIYPAVARPQYR